MSGGDGQEESEKDASQGRYIDTHLHLRLCMWRDVGVMAFLFPWISEYYCTVAYIEISSSPKGDDDLHVWFASSAVSLTLLQGLLGLVLRLAWTQITLMPLMANHERPNSRFSVKPLRNSATNCFCAWG